MQVALDHTREILQAMLQENTGRAMCDSGDYYGRNWQRNQGKTFEDEPQSTYEARVWKDGQLDLSITHSVYHWLAERVTYAPDMDRKLQRFIAIDDGRCDLNLMEYFASLMAKRGATGIYGDGEPFTTNTYNGEDLLSQTLQFTYMEYEGEEFILLQIHGGCDVRGGYTRPRAFTLNSELCIFDNARAVLFPEVPTIERHQLKMKDAPEAPTWFSDDGYHFRSEGYRQHRLEDFATSEDPDDRGQGIICIDEDHRMYCPISGYLLNVAPY